MKPKQKTKVVKAWAVVPEHMECISLVSSRGLFSDAIFNMKGSAESYKEYLDTLPRNEYDVDTLILPCTITISTEVKKKKR